MKMLKGPLILTMSCIVLLGIADTVSAMTMDNVVFRKNGEIPRFDSKDNPLNTTSAIWTTTVTITDTMEDIKDIRLRYRLVGQSWGPANQSLVEFRETVVPHDPPQAQPLNIWKVVTESVKKQRAVTTWQLDPGIDETFPGALGNGDSVTLIGIFPKTSKLEVATIEYSFVNGPNEVRAANFVQPVPLPSSMSLLLGGLAAIGAISAKREKRSKVLRDKERSPF